MTTTGGRTIGSSGRAAAILGIAVLAAAPAHADVVSEAGGTGSELTAAREARQRSDRGRELYERGDYDGASRAYREAYRLRPSPGVLFNLAQAYRQDGRCAEAAGAYRAVLAAGLDGPAREVAALQLEAVDLCVRALDSASLRSNRTLRRRGLITMGAGGAALVLASGFAIAERDRSEAQTSNLTLGLAIGGGAVVTTGAVVFVVAQNRLRNQRRVRPDVFRVPIGSTRVAGLALSF